MYSTDAGIVISSNFLQFKKAFDSIRFILLGRNMSFIFIQFLKEFSSIFSRPVKYLNSLNLSIIEFCKRFSKDVKDAHSS
jgi:hypothetical protein